MEMSEEQKRRMEANRAAALARRCAKTQSVLAPVSLHHSSIVVPHQFTGIQLISNIEGWKKSEGVLTGNHQDSVGQNSPLEKLEVVLEMCAPTKFAIMLVGGLRDHDYFQDCLQNITAVKPCESWKGLPQWPMYNLRDYDLVTQALKGMPRLRYQPIPWPTRKVLEKSLAAGETWVPQRPGHVADTVVENLLQRLPLKLKGSLLPFQWEGVKFGLRRGGRCLLADEMGVGKTIQAIAMAACYKEEGPLLVVCPASMRLVWAEELERWLPFLTPLDLHLVFGRRDEVTEQMQVPKVVVISYCMLRRLQEAMLSHKWGMLIVDESHNLRCTAKKVVSEEISSVLEVAKKVQRIVLLSGTPSISRAVALYKRRLLRHCKCLVSICMQLSILVLKLDPEVFNQMQKGGIAHAERSMDKRRSVYQIWPFDIFTQVECLWPELLGKNKYEFARNYCEYQSCSCGQGLSFKDFSKGRRLQELNILLKQTVMVRRLKEEVMGQLPSKRRQVICLKLAPVDIQEARAFTASTEAQRNSNSGGDEMCKCGFSTKNSCDCAEEIEDENSEGSEVVHHLPQDSSSARSLGNQEIGMAKLRGFREWFLNNWILASCDSSKPLFENTQKKMIVFAHHHKVLDGIQEIIQGSSVELVRIDGTTLAQERLKKVNRFQTQPEVKVAIVGVTAGGVGLNFSAAQNVVFLELPKTASEMLQAEDRAHRRGQKNAVNIYIFCAKGTADEQHWLSMSRSLERVSTITDGAEASFEVEAVLDSSKPCLRVAHLNRSHNHEANSLLLSENRAQPFANDTVIIDSIKDPTQDSCITSESATTMSHSDQSHPGNCSSSEMITNKDMAVGASQPSLGALWEDGGEVEQGLSFFDFPATSLMFEISSNTGRIHLHLKSPDSLSCPIFLQENFKPEDLEQLNSKGGCEKGSLPKCLVNSVAHREEATSFIQQWTSLRPLFRKRLLGRPLVLPLSAELSCLKIETQFAPGGVARGGSKRRYTPKEEVGSAPPEGATWKIIFFHKRCGLKASQATQAWSAQGTPLCKYCQHPCKGTRCKKPESFEDLFCRTVCLEEYLNRTNRRYNREELFKLEGGVCVKCHLDCHALVECVRPIPLDQRRPYILVKAPDFAKHKHLLERLITDPTEGNAWHADHIVAVADGGGECSLENLQTLCVICHSKVTADQRLRRRSEQASTKKGLQKTIMKLLEQPNRHKRIRISSPEGNATTTVVSEGLSDSEDDKELLDIKVAGSAYSTSVAQVVQRKLNEGDLDLKTPPAKDQGSMIDIKNLFSNDDQSPVSCESENGRECIVTGIPDAVAKKPVFSLRSLSRFLL